MRAGGLPLPVTSYDLLAPDLQAALSASPRAAEAFDGLNRTQRYAVILDVVTTRTAATRATHIEKAIASLEG